MPDVTHFINQLNISTAAVTIFSLPHIYGITRSRDAIIDSNVAYVFIWHEYKDIKL